MKRRLNQIGLAIFILILVVFCFQSTKVEAYPLERPTLSDHLQNALFGKRCPKWKAPIDCRDRRDDKREDRDRDERHHHGDDEDGHDRFAVGILRSLYPSNDSGAAEEGPATCTYYEALYRVRHRRAHAVPPGLEGYHGCDRWKRDFDYHQFDQERPGLGHLQSFVRGVDILIGR